MAEISGTKLRYKVLEGTCLLDKSDASGMLTDPCLNSMAGVCGLTLKYEPNKIVFQKPEKKIPSNKPSEGV